MKSKKSLVRIGMALGIVAAVVGAFAAFENCWLTSSERDAAQSALVAVDGLQTSNLVTDEEFAAKAKQAETSVEIAQETALTVRDQNVAFALARYLGSIEVEQGDIRMQNRAQQADADPVGRYVLVQMPADRSAATRSLSLSLHKELD